MRVELIKSSHSVGEANYHIQITAAYRRPVFTDPATRTLTRDYLLAAARLHGIEIAAIGFGSDHVHLFTVNCKNHSAAQVAGLLKGFSSRMMRKNHRALFSHLIWGKKFWTGGYFYRTVGAVNAGTVKHYVAENQHDHWTANQGKQKKLLEFTAN